MEDEEMFKTNLEGCSYRFLQQTAKAMGLPANVKKVYLVQLISTKNYGTPRDLELLVQQVRSEQKHQALLRMAGSKKRMAGSKKRQQSQEVSSTSQSPPITDTPRRLCHSSEMQSPHTPRRLLTTGSDRVLRSSNRVTKPSYLLNNTLMSLMKVSEKRSETRLKCSTSTVEIRKASRNYTKKIIVSWKKDAKIVPVRNPNNSTPLDKEPGRLSGIYPLEPVKTKHPFLLVRRADGSFTKINAIFRSQLAKDRNERQKQFDNLNPFIVKANATPSVMAKTVQNSNISSNFSERRNSNCNDTPSNLSEPSSIITRGSSNISEKTPSLTNSLSTMLNTPNSGLRTHGTETAQNLGYKKSVAEVSPSDNYRESSDFSSSSGSDETTLSNTSTDNFSAPDGEYYHKKIRAERRSSRKSSEIARTLENVCHLPKINEVFPKFSSAYSGDVVQPLHGQVTSGPEIAPILPKIPDPHIQQQGTKDLESMYNLKMLPKKIRQPVSTYSDTYTVNTTPVICSAKMQPPPTNLHNQHNVYDIALSPRESRPFFMNRYEEIPNANNSFSNFHSHEENNNVPPRESQPFFMDKNEVIPNENNTTTIFHSREENNNGPPRKSQPFFVGKNEVFANANTFHSHEENNNAPPRERQPFFMDKNAVIPNTKNSFIIFDSHEENNNAPPRESHPFFMDKNEEITNANNSFRNFHSREENNNALYLPAPPRKSQPFFVGKNEVMSNTNNSFFTFHSHEENNNAPPRESQPFFMDTNEEIPNANNSFSNFHSHEENNNAMYLPAPPRKSQPFFVGKNEEIPNANNSFITFQSHEENNNVPRRESQPFFMVMNEEISNANNSFSNFYSHEENNNGAPTSYFGRSCSSVETITSQEQELAADLGLPEMEDALELISQDGDYMERIGMDIRMQCILCQWAGPKIILEYHIRKEHASDIVECHSNEFSTSYTLGKLSARRVWLSTVLQHEGVLYVLSAKYEDPDYFMATLSTVSYDLDEPKTSSLTTYNKVTGEPFTWTGVVTDLPPCMPYENAPDCFRLHISKMDLLPNSANLKLHNRELVLRSPSKVVVGQPELDKIHIRITTVSYDLDEPKTGSLTTYNKVTGEPFTWIGEVTDLPPCMPYENAPDCFRLHISKMDLLPNSANLKLHNRELVLRSHSKVVVGQPELDNIHIRMAVKILH